MPAMIAHVAAICQNKKYGPVTIATRAPGPDRYEVTVCKGRRELVLCFTWRRRPRRWHLADVRLAEDGTPKDAARSMYELMRMLSDHEPGTGDPSPVRGSRLPRNSALDTKKNTVLRV